MAMRWFPFILAVIASSGFAEAQEDLVSAGESLFDDRCRSCHLVGPPTKFIKSSPNLNDLFGRRPGSLPDYENYSEALVAFGQDKVWDEATLTTFLHDPQGVVVGTRMQIYGIQDDEDLKALLAYLATFDPDGMAPD
jgi:cytochrome c